MIFFFYIVATYSLDVRILSELVNSVNTSWEAYPYERWLNVNNDEIFTTHLGAFLDQEQTTDVKDDILLDLPTYFSSLNKWPNCSSLRDVRDQSNCGSCWAVSAASTMSDRLCIGSGQVNQKRISAQDLLTCCGQNCGYGCNGGYPLGAWKHLKAKGLVSGNEYMNYNYCSAYSFPPCSHNIQGSYKACTEDIFIQNKRNAETPICEQSCHLQSGLIYSQDKVMGKTFYSLANNEETIKSEIYINGPVQATFSVYEDFLVYRSGVYQYKYGKYLGGHAVKIVGWGEENGVPYWEIVNSWNEEWGLWGSFKFLRGSNHLGIESGVVAGSL